MNKKAILSFPISGQSYLYSDTASHGDQAEEELYIFRNHVSRLKEEVNRLSFMMSEIRNVLENSSPSSRSVGVF